MSYSREIWVYCEVRNGKITKGGMELLGKSVVLGSGIGAKVAAVLVGDEISALAPEAAAYGAEKVYAVEDPKLHCYQSEAYASIIADLIKENKPSIFLFSSTDIGDDLAPRVAAKAGTGLTAHCIELRIEDRDGKPLLHQTVPGWGGSKRIDIICPEKRPQMATVKPGLFDCPVPVYGRPFELLKTKVELSNKLFRAKTIEVHEAPSCELPLEGADIVIAAGWGVCSAGEIDRVRELADVICGALGATRPVTDKGFVPVDRMIGQSGKVVSPKLFISLGASGAMHYTTGFEKAKYVLALDQNPHAAIFGMADVGIVGDIKKTLPLLINELKEMRN